MKIASLFLIMTQGVASAGSSDLSTQLKSHWKESSQAAVWRSPVIAERDALREATRLAIAGSAECAATMREQVRQRLTPIDFELLEWPSREKPEFLVMREKAGKRRGGGFYVIRCGKAAPLVLQAPHSFYDVGTGKLVRKLFAEGNARAAFWNTVHRYKASPDEKREDPIHPADVAHEPGNLFHAAAMGAAANAEIKFVQVHGFAATEQIPFEIILSSGQKSLKAVPLRGKFEALGKVALYGEETRSLGAATNAQGRALNRSKPGRFLHIELTRDLRRQLSKSRKLRQQFLNALSGSWWGTG